MNAAVARAGAMPTAAARKARFTSTTRPGPPGERRGQGDKVLYLATVDTSPWRAPGPVPRTCCWAGPPGWPLPPDVDDPARRTRRRTWGCRCRPG
ncbi:hypothetical protein LV779_37080 [Streptomyces thinghirensis]|nr:hypothetical protein [Streptomyces thinghirensis]